MDKNTITKNQECHCYPKGALSAVIRVLEFGATKYQENNWKHVPEAKVRYYDAMQRHIDAWWQGEQKDPETGASFGPCDLLRDVLVVV